MTAFHLAYNLERNTKLLPASVRAGKQQFYAAVRLAPRRDAYVLRHGEAPVRAHSSAALARAAAARDIKRYIASKRFVDELKGCTLGDVIVHLATRKRRR